jgi:hypothetical protein
VPFDRQPDRGADAFLVRVARHAHAGEVDQAVVHDGPAYLGEACQCMGEQGGTRVEKRFQIPANAVSPFVDFAGATSKYTGMVVIIGIQTVEQTWHETLHVVPSKPLKQKKRHYSFLAENSVAPCQSNYLREETTKLMRQINDFCIARTMLSGI